MGLTAGELGELKDTNNDAFLEKFGEAAFKTFLFKLRVKMESYSVSRALNLFLERLKISRNIFCLILYLSRMRTD